MPSPRLIAAIVCPLLGAAGIVCADSPPVKQPVAPRPPRAPRTSQRPLRLLYQPAQPGVLTLRRPDVLDRYPMVVARADPAQYPIVIARGNSVYYPIRVVPPNGQPVPQAPVLPVPTAPPPVEIPPQ